MSNQIDVLAVMDIAASVVDGSEHPTTQNQLREARAAVAELIEAAQSLPTPRGAQVITFEGADYVLLAPEDHEALFNALTRITGAK